MCVCVCVNEKEGGGRKRLRAHKLEDVYIYELNSGVPIVAQQIKKLTKIHEDTSWIPGLPRWVKDSALPQAMA